MLAASCGDDDDDPSSADPSTTETTTTAPADDLCEDREALRSSVDALKGVDVRAEGTDGVETALAAVQDDLVEVGESADSALQPEVDAVQDAIDELEPAVEAIGDGGAAEAATAIAAVATSAATLIESLDDAQCE